MSNALSIFDPANVPAHIVKFNEENSNIGEKSTVDSLTYKGKMWTVAIGGKKTPLLKKNDDGEDEPRTTIPLVILDYNKRRGRSYYAGGYVDDKPVIPDCWSPDGITPDPTSAALQSDKCATCRMAVKGSKTTESGAQTTACSQYRMVAVQLYRNWASPPLRLRLAITSDYDAKNTKEQASGWYAFQQLTDLLRSRGLKHTAGVVVRAKFDMSVPYPKVLFSPVGWLSQDELDITAPLSESDVVKALLSPTFTPNGADGTNKNQAPPAEEEPDQDGPVVQAPAPKPGTGKPKPAKAAPAVVTPPPEEEETDEPMETGDTAEEEESAEDVVNDAEADEEDGETKAQAAAAAAQAAVAQKQAKKVAEAKAQAEARKAAAKAATVEDDDNISLGEPVAPKVVAKAPVGKAPVASAAASSKPSPAGSSGKAKPAAAVVPPTSKLPAVNEALSQNWEDD